MQWRGEKRSEEGKGPGLRCSGALCAEAAAGRTGSRAASRVLFGWDI